MANNSESNKITYDDFQKYYCNFEKIVQKKSIKID